MKVYVFGLFPMICFVISGLLRREGSILLRNMSEYGKNNTTNLAQVNDTPRVSILVVNFLRNMFELCVAVGSGDMD